MEAEVKQFFDSVIIRLSGEIWIKKSWTRRLYERNLINNIKNVLKHFEVAYIKVVRRQGRLFLKAEEAVEAAYRLARVFGISSVSPSLETSSNLENVVNESLVLASLVLKEGDRFAVRCRRVGDHAYSSFDVCRVVGRRILDEFGEKLGLKVDLTYPTVTFGVEIRGDEAFLFSEVIEGVGGMPVGTQPRVIGLLSGGVDSAVSCWMAIKRGCPVVPVYFDNTPFTDETATQRVLEVARVLFDWSVGFPRRVYMVAYGDDLKKIIETSSRRLTCLLCKRLMYRVAEHLAEMVGAEGIVTGEAIGEQASQTLQNLKVLSEAVKKYPIYRPILGFDKAETEKLARKIGIYEVTSKKVTSCGAAQKKPATRAKLKQVVEVEEKLNISEIVEKSIQSIKIVNL